MQAIFQRASIRLFDKDRAVSQADIQTMLSAAMQAPSAMNRQPWEFWVIRDSQLQKVLSACHPYAKPAAEALVVILVAGNQARMSDYWQQDLGACTQNLLLEATHLCLGSVWLGIAPVLERMEYVKNALGLPDEIVPFALVCIGYPMQVARVKTRFTSEYIHYI